MHHYSWGVRCKIKAQCFCSATGWCGIDLLRRGVSMTRSPIPFRDHAKPTDTRRIKLHDKRRCLLRSELVNGAGIWSAALDAGECGEVEYDNQFCIQSADASCRVRQSGYRKS